MSTSDTRTDAPRGYVTDRTRLGAMILQSIREIGQDMRNGRVPTTVTDYSELHDYVDANEYGGACAENADVPTSDLIDVQNAVHAWLGEWPHRPTAYDVAAYVGDIRQHVLPMLVEEDDPTGLDTFAADPGGLLDYVGGGHSTTRTERRTITPDDPSPTDHAAARTAFAVILGRSVCDRHGRPIQ